MVIVVALLLVVRVMLVTLVLTLVFEISNIQLLSATTDLVVSVKVWWHKYHVLIWVFTSCVVIGAEIKTGCVNYFYLNEGVLFNKNGPSEFDTDVASIYNFFSLPQLQPQLISTSSNHNTNTNTNHPTCQPQSMMIQLPLTQRPKLWKIRKMIYIPKNARLTPPQTTLISFQLFGNCIIKSHQ